MGIPKAQWLTSSSLPAFRSAGHVTPQIFILSKGFSVTIQASFNVVQDTGQKITFGERRKVTLSLPNCLRVEAEESDRKQTLVIYDGKAITVFNPGDNVYGQIEKAGSVDDAVRFVIRDLGMRLPLALMLVTTLPEDLNGRLKSIDFVERDTLTPVPTDHLAGRYTERTDVRQQGATERTDTRTSAAQNIAATATPASVVVSGPTYVTVLPCTPTVVAAGSTSYYGCGGSWYNQAYVNGSVTYVTVAPPPGY